jgi:hypothetical protein
MDIDGKTLAQYVGKHRQRVRRRCGENEQSDFLHGLSTPRFCRDEYIMRAIRPAHANLKIVLPVCAHGVALGYRYVVDGRI